MVGLFLAYAGLQFLFGRLPGSANFPTPKLDATVFLFALIVSLATGFLFGTIPALKASRANVAEALKESGRTAGRSRSRVTIANALLVGQVAFSFLLLVTAALFLRSIGRAYEMDPGFQTAHLAVFPASPGQAGYGEAQATAYYEDVRERVFKRPGRSVGIVVLQHAVVGAYRDRPPGGRAPAEIAHRPGPHRRQHRRRKLFRNRRSGHRERARVHRCRPGNLAPRSHRESKDGSRFLAGRSSRQTHSGARRKV